MIKDEEISLQSGTTYASDVSLLLKTWPTEHTCVNKQKVIANWCSTYGWSQREARRRWSYLADRDGPWIWRSREGWKMTWRGKFLSYASHQVRGESVPGHEWEGQEKPADELL